MTVDADDWIDRGVNRRIEPSSGVFNPDEVAALFKNGLLARKGNRVIDKGLLAEPHKDPHDPWKCPKCKLVWPDVLFDAVDETCACGMCMAGALHNYEETALGEGLQQAIEKYLEEKTGKSYWRPDDSPDPELKKEVTIFWKALNKGSLPQKLKKYLSSQGWRTMSDKKGQTWFWVPYEAVALFPSGLAQGWEMLIYAIQTEIQNAASRDK